MFGVSAGSAVIGIADSLTTRIGPVGPPNEPWAARLEMPNARPIASGSNSVPAMKPRRLTVRT